MALVNWGCGPWRAPEPWLNVDVVRIPGNIEPDVIDHEFWADPPTIEALYLGHVLEHVPWESVTLLLARLRGECQPGAEMMIVGPDVNKTLERWKRGEDGWRDVLDILEDDWHYQTTPADTPGARHRWNAYPARVVRAVVAAGWSKVEEVPVEQVPDRWPLVSRHPRQMAVRAWA